jgi:hypothetical protein
MTDVNLKDIEKNFDLSLIPKKNEDPEDAKIRRFKDKWLFISMLLAFGVMFAVCIYILVFIPNSPHTGTALNGIIGLTMALAGYYVRGKTT